jgi:DNA-directed RNA polymerase specialized sigma24 family protein
VVSAAQKRGEWPFIGTATDEELRDRFDELVGKAARGDLRAIGAIAVAFGLELLKEASRALGAPNHQDAGDVVQEFFLAMTEGTLTFPGERGTGLTWMQRMIREGVMDRLRGGVLERGGASAAGG